MKPKSNSQQDSAFPKLDKEQRVELLQLARQAITERVTGQKGVPEAKTEPQNYGNAAVFVTLWQPGPPYSDLEAGKHLRGCIGRLKTDLALDDAVKYAAVCAATQDPRFMPVRADEIDELAIEIAILSSPEKVESLDEIVIGRDGLIIEAMGRRGLLLPKVATRLHWNREEFLKNVSIKAGLPEDIWPGQGTLYKFHTIVFQE